MKAQLKSLLEWKANIEQQQQPQPKCVSRNMPQREAAEFLMRHLEGPARTEMRHRPREDHEDATLLLADILRDIRRATHRHTAHQESIRMPARPEGEPSIIFLPNSVPCGSVTGKRGSRGGRHGKSSVRGECI